MKIFNYSVLSNKEILKEFFVDPERGLDQNKVAKRKIKFGSNSLVLQELNVWHIFLRQFRSAFIYLLLGAMIITIFLNEYIDAFMISVFLTVNVGLGFFQEYRSEKTVKLLNKFTLPRTRVLRDGKIEQIVSTKLVPGDIIILETGDKIPADVRIIEQSNLMVDETILTGESVSVYKKGESLTHQPTAYHEALNLGFSGTDVLKGWAKAVVVATGKNTAFGQIAKLTVESQKISDFEKGISRFSGFIIKLVGLTLFIVLLANIFIKRDGIDILELIIFSVALTVSVIPEALPLVTTFSLARGARRLAQNKVIVKRLSAIEDLGAIEILCSDKTGTLTRNILTVANIYSDNPDQALFLANIASSFELKKKTEPFDIALEQELNSDQKKKINDWIIREGEQGHRVLAIAYKEERGADSDGCTEKIVQEKDFKFLGIVSFVDPIKKSSFATVKKAKGLGVRMMVITGDSPEVAGAVGYEIGLISSPDRVIRGEKWEKMKKEKQAQCLDNYSVFARVSPEQKFKIIESLRERYMVGFLGEGINDAPALKIAGVSLVVDSAADIAREAADIVLLKKNLGVILDGIEEGRQVFANTAKYIKSTLASNFGNFFAVATASLLIDFLPMLPIQILLVNLLSDTPMISISTDSVDRDELVSPKKYEVKDIIIVAIILGLISTVFDFIFFGMFYRISPGVLQTNWFIGSILTELVLIFSIRTKSLFIRGTRSSGPLIWLSIVTFVTTVGLPYTQFGQRVFRFVPPSKIHLILILSLVLIYFTCSEIVKLLYYSSKSKQKIIKTSVV